MLLPQVECVLRRKLGEDDDGLGLPGATGRVISAKEGKQAPPSELAH
ncbi:hypothetical protein DVA67_035110, partial [Solirubrobacter sp. CPCC 204708]|nr:hypothetical protein [Solirubrobacter deserti]